MRLIWIGKTKNEHLRALADEYLKRLARFTRYEVTELRESGNADARVALEEEGRRIREALRACELMVLLDVEGQQQWSSTELAAQLERWQLNGTKEVAYVVGGHLGVAPEIVKRANVRWSLSRLTLTHEMARVLLVEQLYRAHTIMRGLPYQK